MQGDSQVISDLQAAATIECGIQLQYHLDDRLLTRMELDGWAHHADKWGEGSECILKDISDTLIGFRVDPQYSAATPTANPNPQAVLANWLRLETAAHAAYQEFHNHALEVDVDTAHDFKDYSRAHDKRILWIERKSDQIANFGVNGYLLEAI
jgi:bacterioferritin (cytochrome b1)